MRESISCKNDKVSKKFPRVGTVSDPDISDPTPKFKFWLLIFSSPSPEVYRKVCHIPAGQKLMEEIDFLEAGQFLPRAIPWRLADLRSQPKNYLYGVELVLKIFIKIL
jgi:hypothetical protein